MIQWAIAPLCRFRLARSCPPAFRGPVLLAAPIYPAPVLALLAQRPDPSRFHVLGYQDPGRPRSPAELLEESGISAPALSARATALLKDHRR